MKRLRKLFIRIRMEDRMGNSNTLDVTNDEFDVLHYKLYGTMSFTPKSLSNLGSALPLPDTKDATANRTAIQIEAHLEMTAFNIELIFAREC